ncbi:MAG: hypothetical protein ACYC9L_08290 [Sulfuricaulis sp.]
MAVRWNCSGVHNGGVLTRKEVMVNSFYVAKVLLTTMLGAIGVTAALGLTALPAFATTSTSTNTAVDDAAQGTTWNGTEVTGAAAYDTATVSSVSGVTPSGTVTYSFFPNSTCSGGPVTSSTVILSAGAVPNSNTTGPLGAGSYSFQATYSGDSNYTSSTSSCEPFSVSSAATSTNTAVYDAARNTPWDQTEVAGAAAYDTAMVSSVSGVTPTGTVTYSFFPNSTCSGGPDTSSTVILSAGAVPNSNTTGALVAGFYGFQATYSGDSNYTSSTGSCEPFSVGDTIFANGFE